MDVVEQGQLTCAEAMEHWYYRAQFRHLAGVIRSLPIPLRTMQVADFGCGIGLYLMMLEKSGILRADQLRGIDSAFSVKTPVADGNTFIYPAFPDDRLFDVILMMHVLEHIEDDASALKSVSIRCRKGGFLFISVPAFQSLWSSHDVFLGHRRRYNKETLQALICKVPFLKLKTIYYYGASILPMVFLIRLMKKKDDRPAASDLRPAHPIMNRLLLSIFSMENRWARFNRLGGLAVHAVCQIE
ncbi:MAG: methyltransferase domain-containing protein [Deltaproteobacteria bacterium]|nr:methyltransferase domain-containing protein [Deltaproteobacteria bacterium]